MQGTRSQVRRGLDTQHETIDADHVLAFQIEVALRLTEGSRSAVTSSRLLPETAWLSDHFPQPAFDAQRVPERWIAGKTGIQWHMAYFRFIVVMLHSCRGNDRQGLLQSKIYRGSLYVATSIG
jgi:hypothetical protein